MKLYIMRHGKAAAAQQGQDQILTPDGHAAIENLADMLGRQGIRVERILHSGKTRARQTAEIMASRVSDYIIPEVHPHIKPNDNPQALIDDIRHWHSDTLVVSHLPFIPALLPLLTSATSGHSAISFEPGTIICLSPDNDDWQIEWVESPHP